MSRKTTNSFGRVPRWVLDCGLSTTAVAVYATLAANYANREGQAWPSRATLATVVGISLPTLDRATKELLDAGVLLKQRRGRKGGGVCATTFQLLHERRVGQERRHTPRPNEADRRQSNVISNTSNVIADDSCNVIVHDNSAPSVLISDLDPLEPTVQIADVKTSASEGKKPHPIKAVLSEFDRQWQTLYRKPYRFTPQDPNLAKRKGLTVLADDDLRAHIKRYLETRDRFYRGHPFSLFASHIDRFATDGVPVNEPRLPTLAEVRAAARAHLHESS